MTTRVQVIVLTRDRVAYLPECVRSVLAQTWVDLELIVMDNASTQDVPAALRDISDARLSLARREFTEGVAGNFRAAMALAAAPFVMVFHDDDTLHPRLIERQMSVFDQWPELTFVGAGYRAEVDPRGMGRFRSEPDGRVVVFERADELVRHFMATGEPHWGSVLYRRSIASGHGPDPTRFGKLADRPFLLSLAAAGSCAVLRGEWTNWRIHANQDSRVGELREEHVLELFRLYRRVLSPRWDATMRRRFLRFTTNNLLDVHPLIAAEYKRPLPVTMLSAYREDLLHPLAIRRSGAVALLRSVLSRFLPVAPHPLLGSL